MSPTYFCRPTLVHGLRGNTLPRTLPLQPESQTWRALRSIHLISGRRSEPCTTVDSTFQVLLRWEGNDTFVPTAQKFELLSSPFGATVRVRR